MRTGSLNSKMTWVRPSTGSSAVSASIAMFVRPLADIMGSSRDATMLETGMRISVSRPCRSRTSVGET